MSQFEAVAKLVRAAEERSQRITTLKREIQSLPLDEQTELVLACLSHLEGVLTIVETMPPEPPVQAPPERAAPITIDAAILTVLTKEGRLPYAQLLTHVQTMRPGTQAVSSNLVRLQQKGKVRSQTINSVKHYSIVRFREAS